MFHGKTNVAAQALVGDKARRDFACMQADVNFGIEPMQKPDHAHLQLIVRHRNVAVFRHNEIDAHKPRVSGSQFETEDRLREDLLLREASQYLAEIADFHPASGTFVAFATMLALRTKCFRLIELLPSGRYV